MTDETNSIGRRRYLKTTGAAAAATAGLAGCMGGSATGTLATRVTDQPGDIADFESCVVSIVGIWLKPADATATGTTDDEDAGRERINFDSAEEADLVELTDGSSTLLDERELDTGEYEFLQLDVDGVDATLTGGGDATVNTPGDAPLKFDQQFEIRADTRTVFTADFTPVKQGNGNYMLQPVADGTSVEYEE
jgi:hypothetical protein